MDLRQYVENREDLTLRAPFKGFEVDLKYVDREALNRGLDRCKVQRWKKHQPVEEIDDAKTTRYLASLIAGWQGLTLGLMADLTNITVAEADRDKTVPCTEDNRLVVLQEVYDFDQFVIDTVTDVQRFREQKLAGEIPNSNASPGSI